MSNICDFDRILKNECSLQHFTRNCRIKTLDEFDRDEADAYLWRAGTLNMKEKVMTICKIMVFCYVFERRESKCCGALMKNCRKVKDEQVITFQMTQEVKTKNIIVVPGQLFCRQCKAKFLLEADSLF